MAKDERFPEDAFLQSDDLELDALLKDYEEYGAEEAPEVRAPKQIFDQALYEEPYEQYEEQMIQDMPSAKQKKRRSPVVTVLVTIVVILVLVISGLIGFTVYNMTMEQQTAIRLQELKEYAAAASVPVETKAPEVTETVAVETTVATEPPTTAPQYKESGMDIINILVIGQSARKGETKETARLADTMILATVNKETKTLTLSSFLRDAYVSLPDYVDPKGTKHTCGMNKINMAYHLGYQWGDVGGAMEMTNRCIKNNFGIEVDHNIEIDFQGFIDIIDMIGGVAVNLTQAEADYLNKDERYVFREHVPGWVALEGSEALSYARMRKAAGDADSDIKRTVRQRAVISALVEQLDNLSFSELKGLVETALPLVTTDMTNEEITTCMFELIPLLPELKIETGTCPVETTYQGELIDLYGTQSSVLKFDVGQNTRLMQAITEADQLEKS